MNENFLELNKSNVINYLKNKEYGTENVIYNTEEDRTFTHSVMRSINMIVGLEVFRESPFMNEEYDDYEETWIETPVDGKYKITYADRHNPVPAFTEDDVNVFGAIEKALQLKESYYFEIHNNLKKHVRKACKEVGVSFKVDYPGIRISGKEKSASIYKQMFVAYNNGTESISFDSRNINVQTIRVYASQLGAAMGESFSCSIVDGKIIVYFKGVSIESKMRADISKIVEKYNKELSDSTVDVILSSFISRPSILEEEQLMWQQMEFSSEKEYNDYQAKKQADIDDWVKEVEQLGSVVTEDDSMIEEVDGLKQYVIKGFKNDPVTPANKMPVDEDF